MLFVFGFVRELKKASHKITSKKKQLARKALPWSNVRSNIRNVRSNVSSENVK